MNVWPKRIGRFIAHRNFLLIPAAIALATTGCPHNDYVVQLTPEGDTIDRTLIFYRADGTNNANGQPNCQSFNAIELALISSNYPAGAVTNAGLRYTASGHFTKELPDDVGGAGNYMRFTSTLGDTAFYSEHFRGNDDFAGITERHFQAADRLADLILGWFDLEIAHQPGYDQLHHFLDVDFRRDLKNLTVYWQEGQIAGMVDTNGNQEFIIRFCQYLYERGYFKASEVPIIFQAVAGNQSDALQPILQRLVADKLGVPASDPVPACLDFLRTGQTTQDSFNKYLSGTDLYRAKLAQWEEAKKTHPDAQRPDPSTVVDDCAANLVNFNLFGESDHLAVELTLPEPPLHSNGQWQPARQQVCWETDIDQKSNSNHIPFTCYANWVQPDEEFQRSRFNQVILTGDDLTSYCLWRNSLTPEEGTNWDQFVSGLKPGPDLVKQLDDFRFSAAQPSGSTNDLTLYPRGLLKSALQ